MPTIPITMPTIAITTAMTTVCEYSYDYDVRLQTFIDDSCT